MKIRNGYVSNSSSSSFLVCYKDEKEFDKLIGFRGVEDLLNDFSEDEECVKGFLSRCVSNYFWGVYTELEYNMKEMGECSYLKYLTGSYEGVVEFLSMNGLEVDKSLNECETYLRDSKDFEELKNRLEEVMEKSFQIGETVYEQLKDLGYICKQISYADESEYGAYMEHCFMPFLSKYPYWDKISVFTINNH